MRKRFSIWPILAPQELILRKVILKLILVGVCMLAFLYIFRANVQIVDILIVLYGFISIIFIVHSGISLAIATLFLFAYLPLVNISDLAHLGEQLAIYAFYFLLIAALTLIRENGAFKETEPNKTHQ